MSLAGRKSLKPIPKFESEDEEQEYWASHDSTEHIPWQRAKPTSFPDLEEDALTLAADQVFLELDRRENSE
jgi:CopG antitoxin of type II toxin-antitoxin system